MPRPRPINEPQTLLRRDDVEVRARVVPNGVQRTVHYVGEDPITEFFPSCSLRRRDGVWYIGGAHAPPRDWQPPLKGQPVLDEGEE